MVAKFKSIKKTRFARDPLRRSLSEARARRGSWQNTFFSILLISFILIVVGFLVVSNFKMNRRRAELNSRIEELKKEIQVLEVNREALQAKISQSNEESYLEQEARERFDLKKPGEEVVKVLPPEQKTEETVNPEKKWWNPFTW